MGWFVSMMEGGQDIIVHGIRKVLLIWPSTLGSDNYPIIIRVASNPSQDSRERLPRWKLDRADWEAFRVICEDRCEDIVEEKIGSRNEFNERVIGAGSWKRYSKNL